MVEHMVEDGVERSAFFRVGEHDDAKIFFRHEHHTRDKPGNAAGVPDKLTAAIVAQHPAKSVIGKVGFQSGESWRRIADRKNGLRSPHLSRTLLTEQAGV